MAATTTTAGGGGRLGMGRAVGTATAATRGAGTGAGASSRNTAPADYLPPAAAALLLDARRNRLGEPKPAQPKPAQPKPARSTLGDLSSGFTAVFGGGGASAPLASPPPPPPPMPVPPPAPAPPSPPPARSEPPPEGGGGGGGGHEQGPDALGAAAPRRVGGTTSKLARMQGVSEDEMQKDMSAGYMLYRLRLCFGQQLPRPGEQRAKPEVWDRYHVPDKGASFEEKVPSATKPPSSPLCAVEVHGGGGFRCAVGEGQAYTLGATYTTRAVSLDGCAPRWDETCELVCEQPDDAILSIHVYDREPKEGSLIAYEAIPLQALRTGWRVVQLRSPTGSQLTLGSLLVHVAKESRKGAPAAHKGKRGGGGALLALGRTIGRGPATRGAKDAAPPPPQQLPGYRKASVAI